MAAKILKTDFGKQDAVVFMSEGSDYVKAFVLTTGKLYDVRGLCAETMFQCFNTTYPSPINVVNGGNDGESTLTLDGMPVHRCSQLDLKLLLKDFFRERRVFLPNFVYIVQFGVVSRRFYNSHDCTPVSKLPLACDIESTALFNNNILLLYKTDSLTVQDRQSACKFQVYSFSTSNFRTQILAEWKDTKSAVTFYHAGILHILTGRGDLWRIDDTIEAALRLQRCHYGEKYKDFSSTNWYTDIPLCGAVVHGSELVVFSNELPYVGDLPKKTVADYGLKVKFMQILAKGNCSHVRLPESWLTKEI